MGHYLTDMESKAQSKELARVRNDRNDMFVELTRLRAQQTMLVGTLTNLKDGFEDVANSKPADGYHDRTRDAAELVMSIVGPALATLDVPDSSEGE